jgi:hypothetical protein
MQGFVFFTVLPLFFFFNLHAFYAFARHALYCHLERVSLRHDVVVLVLGAFDDKRRSLRYES